MSWLSDLFSDVQQSVEEYPAYRAGYQAGEMAGVQGDEISGIDRLAEQLGIPDERYEMFSEGVQDGLDSTVEDDRPWWKIW